MTHYSYIAQTIFSKCSLFVFYLIYSKIVVGQNSLYSILSIENHFHLKVDLYRQDAIINLWVNDNDFHYREFTKRMMRIDMKKRYLLIALVALSLLSLFVGVSRISPADLLDFNSEETQIFLISRIPRLIAIILAGAGMSIAGLIMQSLSRNKFVSPTTAGTLDATRLGILISMLVFTNATYLQKL